MPPGLLGLVVASERRPNTTHEFHFWTAVGAPVGIGTIVRVDGGVRDDGQLTRIYGIVVEGYAYTDVESPMYDVLGHDGDPRSAPFSGTERTDVRVYTAAVLRQIPEEPLQPVPMGKVFVADDLDVAIALRMDAYRERGIPIGLYRGGGMNAPIYVDPDFLLGPEAAHLNISGVSGLATKTSAVEWLLASMFAHLPPAKGSVAAVCFNVKGTDLCFLDQPGELDEKDLAMYEALKVPAVPFRQVQYFAPRKSDDLTLNTLRSNEELVHSVHPLAWGLSEVLQYAEVLLNKDDVDAKADALIDFIRERVVNRRFQDPSLSQSHDVRSFADLEAWFVDVLRSVESGSGDIWRTHHVATIRKVRNRLTNIHTRCAGLVTSASDSHDLPFGDFRDRTVYVVDVALLEEDAQDLVFTRIVSKLREHLERRDLGVQQVVVFVDELNKYAAADGPDTYVRKMLLDIAERGRYLGMVLFGAQQFRSQVHRRVVGNAGTTLFGRMDVDELATPGYAVLSPAVRTKLATLSKGQLMVRHPHFSQPVFVNFPRPPVMRGRDGIERFPRAVDAPFSHRVLRALRQLDRSLTLTWVEDAIALHEEGEVTRAVSATQRARPSDVRKFFTAQFRSIIPAQPAPPRAVSPIRALPNDDPYAG